MNVDNMTSFRTLHLIRKGCEKFLPIKHRNKLCFKFNLIKIKVYRNNEMFLCCESEQELF